MPPSKEIKPCVSPVEETTEKAKPETASEMSPDSKKKTGPPPTPPSKPSSSSTAEASQSKPNPHPPAPPSKEKKPSHPDQQVQDTANENAKKEEQRRKESKGIAWDTAEADQSPSSEAESPSTEGEEDESGETISSETKTFDSEPHISTEPLRKSPSPPMASKEKPEIIDPQHTETCSASKEPDSTASESSEEALPKSEVCSLNEPLTDSLNSSPLLCHLSGEKKKKAEEKSVDSGQHSDDESEGSGSEDPLATSTAALRGSHAGLDVLDTSEDIQTSVNTRMPQAVTKVQVSPKIVPSLPIVPLKPSVKVRSASIGDLLSEPPAKPPGKPRPRSARPPSDATKLETEVALEIEKTSELQSRVSRARGESEGGDTTEDLLAKAMEKLKKADDVLREVKKLKLANSPSKRKSW